MRAVMRAKGGPAQIRCSAHEFNGREDLICIPQKTAILAKDYTGENYKHFLPSPNDKNRNTAN
jgi:hypothetical protein